VDSLKQVASIIFLWFPVFLAPIFLARFAIDGWEPSLRDFLGESDVRAPAAVAPQAAPVASLPASEDERILRLRALLASCDTASSTLEGTLRIARSNLDLVRARLHEAVAVSQSVAVALDR
jgi:hypothetical protein